MTHCSEPLRDRQCHGSPVPLVRPVQGTRSRLMLLLLCLLVVTACEATSTMNTPPPSNRDPMQGLTDPFSQEQAVAFIGQPFPPSASDIQFFGEAALDTMVIARFEAPRQDLAAYLAGLGVTTPLKPNYSPFFSADSPFREATAWWAPPVAGDTSSNFSGLYQQVGRKHFKVVVVEPENGATTIYLQVYNT